uniref:Uncharacterized protein n=1 Tax=viral metagenome TaxID=1070528 RepID=A0A6C0EX69_9ZZZZ
MSYIQLSSSPPSDKYSPKIEPKTDPITECEELVTIVRGLYDKYLDDDYARTALVCHIKNTLPTLLQQKCDARIQREERRKTLEETSEEFIREFINSSSYFYNPNIDLFFVYHNNTYKIINEDEIEHEIRTTITDQQNSELSTWKYKIKNQIIKKIKERDLLTSIPESETIQRVLNALTPFVFKNKDSAKYFLTVIGDILLKKNTNTYFISTKAKHFISELGEESYALFGTSNMMNHFKFKFYEHKYEECRLIDIVENVISFPFYTHNEGLKLVGMGHNGIGHSSSSSSLSSLVGGGGVGMSMSISNSGISTPKTPTTPGHSHMHSTNVIQKQSMLDLFCVAAHYSSRFNSADLFIEKTCKDCTIKEHAFYLKTTTDDGILSRFISSTTDPCKGVHITWKNMLYLWKIFIEEEKIPNVFFTNVLKKHLMKRLEYSCEHVSVNVVIDNDGGNMGGLGAGDLGEIMETQDNREMFLNITSKHLPLVGKFMSFWNENIRCNHSEIELEIDEMSTLFLNHGNVYHGNQKNIQTITDQTILGFIRHFLPDICIEEDKYLMNIGCKLWDKKQEILNGVEEFKRANLGGNNTTNGALGKGKNKNKDVKDVNIIIAKKEKDNDTDLSVSSASLASSSSSFPVHTIYDFYCKWGYKHNKMVVSKRYFEKFFIDNYSDNLTEKNGTLWWSY